MSQHPSHTLGLEKTRPVLISIQQMHRADSPLPDIWHYFALSTQPLSLVPHKYVIQGTFRVRKVLLMKGVWHLLTFLHPSEHSCVVAATARQVGEQRAWTDFIHTLFFVRIVNFSGRLQECLWMPWAFTYLLTRVVLCIQCVSHLQHFPELKVQFSLKAASPLLNLEILKPWDNLFLLFTVLILKKKNHIGSWKNQDVQSNCTRYKLLL